MLRRRLKSQFLLSVNHSPSQIIINCFFFHKIFYNSVLLQPLHCNDESFALSAKTSVAFFNAPIFEITAKFVDKFSDIKSVFYTMFYKDKEETTAD